MMISGENDIVYVDDENGNLSFLREFGEESVIGLGLAVVLSLDELSEPLKPCSR